jgi:hypothetical protein
MKKRLFKGLTAAITAVVLAVMTVILPVSATFTYRGVSYPGTNPEPSSANHYATETVYYNGSLWFPNYDAYYEKNEGAPSSIRAPHHAYSSSRQYFNASTGDYIASEPGDSPYIYRITRTLSDTEGNGTSYKAKNGKFYPNKELAQEAGYTLGQITLYEHRGSGNYFNVETGRYYKTLADALNASGSAYDIRILVEGVWYDRNYTETYFNPQTHYFYLSEAEAYAAAPTNKISKHTTATQGYYYNLANGNFYLTYDMAVAHSKAEDVIRATSFSFSNGILDSFGFDAGYYGMPTYTPIFRDDTGYNSATPTDTATSSSPYDEGSTAALRSNLNQKGWAVLAKLVNNSSAGANILINLNQDTYVSSTFMKAVAGRDINVTLVSPVGATIRFSGLDIYSPKDMPVAIAYSATIPTDVYQNTRSVAGADSSSVLTFGENVDLGAVVTLNVRFNASRVEDTAELYLYSAASKKASLVDSKEIGENGATAFEIRKGGQFIVCIKEAE